jgi:two-component system, NtrC family, sensor kinase
MSALDEPPTARELDLLSRYLALTREVFLVIGFDGVFREVDGDVEGLIGWSAEQLRERRFSHFLHPEEVGLSENDYAHLVGGGVTVEFVNRFRTRKREWPWLKWRAIGVPELELVYAVARPGVEQQPTAPSTDLQESLRVVTGFLELLERRYADRLDEDGIQFVRAALSGARRMQRL